MKSQFTIVYSSPYYFLYNENTNQLLKKDVDEKEVIKEKKELEYIHNKLDEKTQNVID